MHGVGEQGSMVLWGVMVNGHWQPGIGDDSWLGWLTVGAYFGAAIACGRCGWGQYTLGRSTAALWMVLTVVLVGLGINKQLDLQSWFTEFGRQVALDNGWYRQRRTVQREFITALGLGAIAGLGVSFWAVWHSHRKYAQGRWGAWLACGGLGFLLAFVTTRAASFHHVDRFLKVPFLGVRMNGVLELSGIALMAIGALLAYPPRPSR